MKNKGQYGNVSERGRPVQLPKVKGVYNKHPGEGMRGGSNVRKLCGLCGAVHGPGEPHAAKQASNFNAKNGKMGVARIGGGYIAPMDSSRNLNTFNASMKKNSIGNNSQTRSQSQN